MALKGLKYQSSKDRQAWEDFCQRLGVCIRAGTVVKVLDSITRNPRLSPSCSASANRLLEAEFSILAVHRDRKVTLC